MAVIFINTDGGSRSNPGPAACGVVIATQELELFAAGKFLGVMTNNEAEYEGLLWATQVLQQHPEWVADEYVFRLDSQLVVEQTQGRWKIKEERMRRYVEAIRQLWQKWGKSFRVMYIPRAQNSAADALVNQALDAEQCSQA